MNKLTKAIVGYNPYYQLSFLFGYLFWPLTLIKPIKEDFMPLLRMINKLFTKSKISTFLAFWYPMIFVGILGSVGHPQFMVFNIGSFIPMIIGVQVMPVIILTLKQSSVLKRIGATETKTWHLTAAFVFYFSLVSIISSVMNIGAGIGFYSSSIMFDQINWGQLVLSVVIAAVVGLSMGMFISGIVKNQDVAMAAGLLLTLPGAFLSGQFLPPNLIDTWGPVRYIAFIFPQKFATVFTQNAVNGHSMFDFNTVKILDWDSWTSIQETLEGIGDVTGGSFPEVGTPGYDILRAKYEFNLTTQTEMIMAWALLPTYVGLLSVGTVYTFRWSTR